MKTIVAWITKGGNIQSWKGAKQETDQSEYNKLIVLGIIGGIGAKGRRVGLGIFSKN